MKKTTAFCLMFSLMGISATDAAITGSIIPNPVSPIHGPGETKTYTLSYSVDITSGPAKADVLFLTDTTASMGGYISGLKSAAGDILSGISAALPGLDPRYAVADYRDYGDGGYYRDYGVNLRQPFTDDDGAVQSAINRMYATGGHDIPEGQLKAMVALAKNWLNPSGIVGCGGRLDAQKILIWAGDAEGHYFGEGGDGPSDYYPSLADALVSLNRQGVVTIGLNTAEAEAGIDKDYGGDNQATYITEGTGGQSHHNVSSASAEIQALIVDAVTASVETLSNITLALQSDNYFLVAPLSQTRTGSWTPDDGTVSGSFSVDITSPTEMGFFEFDLVLLGNGAELDRVHVNLTTAPEPSTLVLLGLSSLGLRRRRRN
ncbi:MAG: VWA domain-containing protein [Sedimentisphaerales bacterium]|nr:VWA domain-containing protein [Sedimentisphaerales bacterium]